MTVFSKSVVTISHSSPRLRALRQRARTGPSPPGGGPAPGNCLLLFIPPLLGIRFHSFFPCEPRGYLRKSPSLTHSSASSCAPRNTLYISA